MLSHPRIILQAPCLGLCSMLEGDEVMEEGTAHMPRTDNLYELPHDLPVPLDDGACAHLTGISLPAVPLASTAGCVVDLTSFAGRTVVYGYPRTGRPDQEPPIGWNAIPGARG